MIVSVRATFVLLEKATKFARTAPTRFSELRELAVLSPSLHTLLDGSLDGEAWRVFGASTDVWKTLCRLTCPFDSGWGYCSNMEITEASEPT